MRSFFLAAVAVLTASLSVSATPAIFGRDKQCVKDGGYCDIASDCCSNNCYVSISSLHLINLLTDPLRLVNRMMLLRHRIASLLLEKDSEDIEELTRRAASESFLLLCWCRR
ncbi:hypothetical protein F4604DRAFT_761437 [Suillus subluteus]|nr:hypothetical protein F4604DRAFT_761437 [Suillus subluteus]